MLGAVKLAKHSDIDQEKYSRYDTGFDTKGLFFTWWWSGRNVIIFRVDMLSSPHVDNKKK